MKYNKTFEDNTILENINIEKLAQVTGISKDYLYKLKRNERIATNEVYKKLKTGKDIIDNNLNQDIDLSFVFNEEIVLDNIL